jgi:hypothetical protein
MTDVRRGVLAAAVIIATIAAPTAAAKIWFGSVGGDTYSTGAAVTTKIAGCPTPCPVAGASIALGRDRGLKNPTRPVTRPVGVVGRRGGLTFRVPEVRRGRYRLVARVRGGRWYIASAPFAVVGAER